MDRIDTAIIQEARNGGFMVKLDCPRLICFPDRKADMSSVSKGDRVWVRVIGKNPKGTVGFFVIATEVAIAERSLFKIRDIAKSLSITDIPQNESSFCIGIINDMELPKVPNEDDKVCPYCRAELNWVAKWVSVPFSSGQQAVPELVNPCSCFQTRKEAEKKKDSKTDDLRREVYKKFWQLVNSELTSVEKKALQDCLSADRYISLSTDMLPIDLQKVSRLSGRVLLEGIKI